MGKFPPVDFENGPENDYGRITELIPGVRDVRVFVRGSIMLKPIHYQRPLQTKDGDQVG